MRPIARRTHGRDSTGVAVSTTADEGLFWSGGGPTVAALDIELTERCNNACVHCSINLPSTDEHARTRELSTEEVERVLREAAELGVLSVRFTGGEPLLRDDFGDLYLLTRRLGLKVLLFTNGRLVTPTLVSLLARVPPLLPVEVTAYGMTRTSYERVSAAAGSFREYRRGVRLLLDARIPLVVKGVVLPATQDELDDLDRWAATLPAMTGPVEHAMFFELRSRRDSPAKNRRICGLRVTPEQGVAVLERRPGYRQHLREFCRQFLPSSSDRLFVCEAGRTGCVDAYGMVQACVSLRHPATVFDLRRGSLREAFEGFFPALRERRATDPAFLVRCARCVLRGLCEQCPARSWTEHGTLDTPVEYFCDVAHAQAREIGLLRDGERGWEIDDWEERSSWS
jgi:radical SAM protein with 4Fe4S-binding SPASM domain